MFDTDFRSDFFSMLRSWHNNRATVAAWKQLDLALVTSTEPYQLIDNLNQSPFNVGEVIELTDLAPEQVAELNNRHNSPFNSGDKQKLMALLGGHPYLVRRALYLVASQRMSVSDLFDHAMDDRGPFGDHLRYHLFRMHDKQELVDGLKKVISHNICQDEHIFFRLRGAGLVRETGVRSYRGVSSTPIISGSTSMSETHVFTVGGTVQASNGLYIPRRADDELLALCRAGSFPTC